MNYTRAIFLISDDVRAVNVNYDGEKRSDGTYRNLTMYKTFDKTLKAGDYVVVPTETRHHMTVCKVVEVDVEPDLEAPTDIHWIIGVVDRADFENMRAQEQAAIDKIKSAEKARKRRELKESLLADMPEGEVLSITAVPSNEAQG